MKLKDKITGEMLKAFELKVFGTNDKPVERPNQAAHYNDFVVRAAMSARWFVADFDPDSETGRTLANLRKEIEARYLDELGVTDEAKEHEKN